MLVRALLKSSDTDRASCNAHSSFCLSIIPPASGAVLVSPGACAMAETSGAVADTGTTAGNNCKTNHLRPSELKAQIAAVNFIVAPFATRNFKSAVMVGDCSQRAKNSSGFLPFSGDQIAANGGDSPVNAAPNVFVAAVFERNTAPPAFNNNAGHAAPSNPNTTSGVIQINQSIVAYRSFKKFQGMTDRKSV